MPKICYWSVADGEWAYMLKTLLHSYRGVGMEEDFHVFSDQEIPGATTHLIEGFDKSFYHFKFQFLQQFVKQLDYDYFVFLDADNFFVRKAPPFLNLVQDSPLHCFLESDCTLPSTRPQWHRCPLPEYVRLMQECGVTDSHFYTVNAGFFIVKREAIDTICELAVDFWKHCMMQGYLFTEEAPLAYATQMLCGDSNRHLLSSRTDVWASDWTGIYEKHLPDGKSWTFQDYMGQEGFPVDPAIVHALKSKEILIDYGRGLTQRKAAFG